MDALGYADNSYKILENYLNGEMREISQILVQKYQEHPDIHTWDLESLKERFGDYEIYIVNKDLEVVRTTFKEDLGLDFKRFPNFAELLRKRLAGDDFAADRMDISTATQKLQKYSYMPTPDHNYLLELSIDIQEAHPSLKSINVFEQADKLTREYNLVQGISFYKTNQDGSDVGLVTRGEGPYLDTNISGQEEDLVQEAVLSKEPQVLESKDSNLHRTDKYIPHLSYKEDNELDWWNSYVVRIAYDGNMLASRLKSARNVLLGKTALLALIFILFQIVLVHLFRRTKELASVDVLTKLPNRKMLQERFKRITSQPGQRKVSHKLALLFVDLNEFKAINDNYGHHIGDAVLQEVAGILQSVLRSEDIVVRAGGDEFMVLLTGVASKQDVYTVVLKIKEALLQPMLIEDYSIGLQVSVGISMYPDDARSLQELTKMADAAMYRAKGLKTEQISWALSSESTKHDAEQRQ